MEKDFFTWTQNPATFPIEMPGHHSWNCSPDMDLYNTRSNWDLSLDQTDPFESALSSIVSSSATPAATAGRGGVLLNGKLGGICSPSEISTHSSSSYIAYPQSSDNSCYSAPMNSPPKLSVSTMDQMMLQFPALTPFGADHGYEERAARFSCFGSRSLDGMISSQLSVNDAEMAYNSSAAVDSEKLQRVASCQLPGSHLDIIHKKFPENMSDSKEESSVSQKVQINDGIGKKRKSIPPLKAKTSKAGVESKNSDSKRRKSDAKNQKQQHKENSKPPEPPKDYIHVRARRGQATDSHSLAERVRREKISERMKFLQDLVPGCNKVSGKAIMLDEIINYLQSLQRQVECLSMKLATVNPRMDSVHMEALLSKEILQSRKTMYPVESSSSASAAAYQSQEPPFCNDSLNNDHHQHNLQLLSINGFCNSASQVSMWEDELHNVVQMGFHVI